MPGCSYCQNTKAQQLKTRPKWYGEGAKGHHQVHPWSIQCCTRGAGRTLSHNTAWEPLPPSAECITRTRQKTQFHLIKTQT